MQLANARREPIPVYAEMSSINPVFLLPAALADRAEAIGKSFVDSLTMGAGQFCTNPGLVLAVDGPDLDRFIEAAADALASKPAQTMLTPGIFDAYCAGARSVGAVQGVTKVAQGEPAAERPNAAQAALYVADAARLLASPELEAEMFGPASVVIRARDFAELLEIAEHLEGQLTVTLQIGAADASQVKRLLPVLERKAGRILPVRKGRARWTLSRGHNRSGAARASTVAAR
jgi:NADP-dependent aldehyde dehydrogenase